MADGAGVAIDDELRGDLARYATARRRLGATQALLFGALGYSRAGVWFGAAVVVLTLAPAFYAWRGGGWCQRRTVSRWREDPRRIRNDLRSMGPLAPR